jgi:YVTN family beta-propeller protein
MITINKFRALILGATLAANAVLFSACQRDNETTPKGEYESGVFVVNEGQFGKSNGEISFYNRASKEVQNGIFTKKNSTPLGDVVQSMAINNDDAYIIVNNSKKVEVVDANTFESKATINDVTMPRYMVINGNKGYITEWVSFSGNGNVAVIDLASNTITKRIAVGRLPEQLLLASDSKLYVTNMSDSIVSVINTTTEQVEKNIVVQGSPNSIVQDKNNVIWVLSGVRYDPDTYQELAPAALVKIQASNQTVQATFSLNNAGASKLIINPAKDKLYYNYGGGVYQQDVAAASLNSTPLITRSFYGLGVDPTENVIYGGDAGNYVDNGKVIRYNAQTGAAIDSFTVSVAPNGFVFR